MSFRSVVITTAFMAFTAIPMVEPSFAAPEAPPQTHSEFCLLNKFKVTQVGSYYVEARGGQGTYEKLAGAQLFLPAQPGLTAEWIGANLAQHKKAPPSYKCPLDVDGVEYKVAPAKTGFWVQLSAPSAEGAQEVLDRSRALIR